MSKLSLYNKGLDYFKQKKYREALECFEKSCESAPNTSNYWNYKGNCEYYLNKYSEALFSYSKACELDPNKSVYWNKKGFCEGILNQYSEALNSYSKACELDPNKPIYWNNKGNCEEKLNLYSEASNSYCKACELDPSNPEYWNNRGKCHEKLKSFKEATDCFNEALNLDSDNKDFKVNKKRVERKHYFMEFGNIFNLFIPKLIELKNQRKEMKRFKTKADKFIEPEVIQSIQILENFVKEPPIFVRDSNQVKNTLEIENKFHSVQKNIKRIKSKDKLNKKIKLLETRNKLRKSFVSISSNMITWIENLNLLQLKEKYLKTKKSIEKIFKTIEEEGKLIDTNDEKIVNYNEDLSRFLEAIKELLKEYEEEKEKIKEYLNSLEANTENCMNTTGNEFSRFFNFLSSKNEEGKLNIGQGLIKLEEIISKEREKKLLNILLENLLKKKIKIFLFNLVPFYSLSIQEIDSVMELYEEMKSKIEIEKVWEDRYPEKEIAEIKNIEAKLEEKQINLVDVEAEIRKLKLKKSKSEEIEKKENEFKILERAIRDVNKKREISILNLSKICVAFFPELKLQYPEFNIASIIENDGLERNRNLSDYDELKQLKIEGGSRHIIYKAKWNNQVCILKYFQLNENKELELFKKEIKILNKLKHPNIAEIECYFIENDRIGNSNLHNGFVQMPYYEGGQLDDWIKQNKPNEFQLKNISREILRGLEYLHDNGIIHCDIKPQNILITKEGKAKISDFDISKNLEGRKQTVLTIAKSSLIGGTMNYMSPEVFQQKGVYKESDIYSFGLILFDIYFPSVNRPIVAILIHENKSLEIPNHENTDLMDLLKHLLKLNYEERISARKALSHSYLTESMNAIAMEMKKFFQYPSYWISSSPFVQAYASNLIERIDATQEMKSKIQSIVDKTCISEFIGMGRDSRGLRHTGYEVIKIERIENKYLWRNYYHQRELIQEQINSFAAFSNFIRFQTFEPWMHEEFGLKLDINELFLFHGTKSELINSIILQGFEERISSLEGLFGGGIYFTENSSKSDEYITPDSNGLCYMFLSRVCMGNYYQSLKPMNKIRRPPFVHNTNNTKIYDSILGECQRTGFKDAFLKRYREFIVYDRRQTYPEFLITFKRIN